MSVDEKLKMMEGKKGDDLKKVVVKLYPDLFERLGRIDPPHTMKLAEDYAPTIEAPRKIPETIRIRLKEELERMEAEGIVEKVDEPTDWVSNLVIVEKPDESLRLCLDPRNLNKNLKREHYQLPTFDEIAMRLTNATFQMPLFVACIMVI